MMANDKSNSSQSRSRRFARGLFSSSSSSSSKENTQTPQWLAPRTNSLVPEVQSDSRPRTPVEKPKNSRIPSPIPEDPPEEEEEEAQQKEEEKPLPQPDQTRSTITKRLSRQSLFDLFSKPKVEKARGHHEEAGNTVDVHAERSHTPLPFAGSSSRRRQVKSAQIDLSPVKETKQSPYGQETLARSSSRLSLRPSKQNLTETITSPTSELLKPNESWAPPPLFQAYPQAVKHAKLQSVTASTEIFLRSQQIKRNLAIEASGSNAHIALSFSHDAKEPQAREPTKLKRQSMADHPDLIEKVFVLVTAGRLLQYSTSGYSDRSPEKILTLGPQSAAFACDLVPGKPYVVQVLQSTEDINQSALRPQRSLMNRLKVTGSISGRKITTSVLLILTSATEMDIWIKAIRKIIEQVGGKPRGADPEVARTKEQEARQQQRLNQLPSHRFLVHRDSQRFTDDRRDSISPVMPPAQLPKSSPNESKRLSFLASTDSIATTSPSPDITPLLEQDSFDMDSRRQRLSVNNSKSNFATTRNVTPELLRLEPLKETSRFSSTSTRASQTPDSDRTSTTPLRPSPPRSRESFPEKSFARFGPLRPKSSNPNVTVASRRRSAQPNSTISAVSSTPQDASGRRNAIIPPALHTDAEKTLRLHKTMSLVPESMNQPAAFQENDTSSVANALANISRVTVNNPPEPKRSSINFSTPRYAPVVRNSLPNRPQSSIGNVSVQSMRGKDGRVFSDPIHTAPRARPFFRPLPVRPVQTGEPRVRAPPPARSESMRALSTQRPIGSGSSMGLPQTLAVDDFMRKVLEERMMEERLMMEKMIADKQAAEQKEKSESWQVQVTKEVITEVTILEPDVPRQQQPGQQQQQQQQRANSQPNIPSDVVVEAPEEKVLSDILEVETFEEGILDLNAIDEKTGTDALTVRPSTPKLKRASIQDLLSMKEPSPERPVLSIQQRSRADPMHYSQVTSRPPALAKRVMSTPLPNPPSMPLPAPPPSHMPSLSTRPSSRNAFAPPPATGIRPGRRTPSVTSVSGGRNISSRSTSPTNNHSRQSSLLYRDSQPPSPPKPELDKKLRRPNSVQISADHAPFLSARRGGSGSQKPNGDQAQQLRSGHILSASQNTPFSMAKLSTSHEFEPSSMVEIREVANEGSEAYRVSPSPFVSTFYSSLQQSLVHKHASPTVTFSSNQEMKTNGFAVDPFVTEPTNLRPVSPLIPETSNSSSRAPSSQVSPSLDTSARSTSPTNSDHSDSVILEIGSPIRRMSSPRLSYIGPPSAPLRTLSPPPLPPMNPNRLALKNQLSLPTMPTVSSASSLASMSSVVIADLPPPVPPPSCPLPDVPKVG